MAIIGTTLFCDLFDNIWQIEIRTDEKFLAFSTAANDAAFYEFKDLIYKLENMNDPISRVVLYQEVQAWRV